MRKAFMKNIKVIRNIIGILMVIVGIVSIFYSYIVGFDTKNAGLFTIGILGGFALIFVSSAIIDTPFRNGFDDIKEDKKL
jgi:uncharacterized membrane protein HdeD (DUF308 family)